MSYFENINDDYCRLKKNLETRFGALECVNNSNFKEENIILYHRKLVEMRDILSHSANLSFSARLAMDDGVSDFLDFIWLVYIGRYKSATASLRNGMDIFGRGLIRIYSDSAETNYFSSNIEKVLKELRIRNEINIHGVLRKKAHKKFISTKFKDNIIKIYGELSDTVHGKKADYSNLAQFIDDSLNFSNNQDSSLFNSISGNALKLIEFLLSILILVNYDMLNQNMNIYRLNLISDSQNDYFRTYKYEYLSLN